MKIRHPSVATGARRSRADAEKDDFEALRGHSRILPGSLLKRTRDDALLEIRSKLK
jgi:hypothetical protein